MNRLTLFGIVRLILLLVVVAIPFGVAQGYAQESAQPPGSSQTQNCDGTLRSGNTNGQRRSISNCDRKAAAQRAAERRAAVRKAAAPLPKGGKQ